MCPVFLFCDTHWRFVAFCAFSLLVACGKWPEESFGRPPTINGCLMNKQNTARPAIKIPTIQGTTILCSIFYLNEEMPFSGHFYHSYRIANGDTASVPYFRVFFNYFFLFPLFNFKFPPSSCLLLPCFLAREFKNLFITT